MILLSGEGGAARADAAPDNPTVAVVDGASIDANQVRKEMIRQGADFLPRFTDVAEKKALVEKLVRIQVLAHAAREQGYAADPEIVDSLNRLLAEKFWRDSLAEQPIPRATEEEARAYYDSHLGDFVAPQRARGALIFLRWPSNATPEQRVEIRAEAEGLRAQAGGCDEACFAALVDEHTDDPAARRRRGDTGFIVQGAAVFRIPPPVVDALFEVDAVGGVAPVVETDRGLYIARLSAREGGAVPEFALVEREVRARLSAERIEAREQSVYEELRKRHRIEVDLKALETIGPGQFAAGERPPSFPVGAPAR